MTVIHLVVNVLAALLLAASNYCMQMLISPLREEVDIAHKVKKWMYVGVPNFKKLRHIHWTRRLLVLILAVSSLPVHLIRNSAIVQETPANDYHVAAVSEEFVSGAPIDPNAPELLLGFLKPAIDAETFARGWYKYIQQDPGTLTIAECLTKYSQPFNFDYNN